MEVQSSNKMLNVGSELTQTNAPQPESSNNTNTVPLMEIICSFQHIIAIFLFARIILLFRHPNFNVFISSDLKYFWVIHNTESDAKTIISTPLVLVLC